MEMMIQNRQQMYLATTFDLNKETAISKLNAFLTENGIVEPKRYFAQLVTIQRTNVTTTYIEYAVVSKDTVSTKDVNVGKMGEGQNLVIRVDKDEFESYKMGESKQEIKTFLKDRKMRLDNVYIFPYMDMDGDDYIIYTPVK